MDSHKSLNLRSSTCTNIPVPGCITCCLKLLQLCETNTPILCLLASQFYRPSYLGKLFNSLCGTFVESCNIKCSIWCILARAWRFLCRLKDGVVKTCASGPIFILHAWLAYLMHRHPSELVYIKPLAILLFLVKLFYKVSQGQMKVNSCSLIVWH